MSSILTIDELRIIIKNYYPPKPIETNYLSFMNENFLQTFFALLLKNGISSFKDLAGQINNINFPELPKLPELAGLQGLSGFPNFQTPKNEGSDPSFYDGTNQISNSRQTSLPLSNNDIKNSSISQRINDYNNIKYNPSSGNIYGTQFTEDPSYIYYEDILRRLYMINDYFF
jgi:hypothetical protein